MPVFKIQNFGGMVPAMDDRLIPDNNAAYCLNAWLYEGTLKGIVSPTPVHTCGSTAISKVYRIPNDQFDIDHMADSTWMEFEDPNTDVVRAPVVGDTFERYYWVSPNTQASYNTLARIKAGSPSFLLGVPTPVSAVTVAVAGGVSTQLEARAYVVTYVSAYGEEGAPSPPSVTTTGKVDDTWTLTLPVPGSGITANRNLVSMNIYRTVTGSDGVATFQFVDTVALATTTYADTTPTTAVTGNATLESTSWTPPPDDLQGMIVMPNGMIAGWRKNEVWFCEPYRPHAWPVAYTIAVDYPIVGLGVVQQTLVICTAAFPWAASGINPGSMTLSKLNTVEPCTSRGSIISAPEGVYYASQNGLVLVSAGLVVNITKQIMSKDRWQGLVPLTSLFAARLGTAYYGFGSRLTGCFDPDAFNNDAYELDDYTGSYDGALIATGDDRVAFDILQVDTPTAWVGNDPWTGEVFFVREGVVYWLNIGDQNPTYEPYLWRSKRIQTMAKDNFAGARVYFEVPPTAPALNPTRNIAPVQTLADDQYALLRLYADGNLISTRELRTSAELVLFPSNFRADFWQLEIEGRVTVINVQMATSIKELLNV